MYCKGLIVRDGGSSEALYVFLTSPSGGSNLGTKVISNAFLSNPEKSFPYSTVDKPKALRENQKSFISMLVIQHPATF